MMKGRFLASVLVVVCGGASNLVLSFQIGHTTFTRNYVTPTSPSSLQTIKSVDIHPQVEQQDVDALGIHVPFGLREELLTNAHESISKRIWIVDNSGSMGVWDGHVCHHENEEFTRWDEVQETVLCHAQLSAALGAPTDFRLLNPPKGFKLRSKSNRFSVGYHSGQRPGRVAKDFKRAESVMLRNSPNGGTPLPAAVREVKNEIMSLKPHLEAEGRKVCIVIATDGSNHSPAGSVGIHKYCSQTEAENNRDLVEALESLQGLPVCVVIRLCTDLGPLVDFYNDLDEHLPDLDIDVLDDHWAESKEVNEHNPWLNYALVLHRMREMGQASRLFDWIDERPFTQEEVRDFCVLLFGLKYLKTLDWPVFLQEIDRLQKTERKQKNPLTKEMEPWINVRELATIFAAKS